MKLLSKEREGERNYWVNSLLLPERRTKRMSAIFFNDIRRYGDKFFNFTSMSDRSFGWLLSVIRISITGMGTYMR